MFSLLVPAAISAAPLPRAHRTPDTVLQPLVRSEAAAALAPEVVQTLVQHASRPSPPGEDLSPRKREVLVLRVEGLSNPVIASRLVVARSTVNFHVGNILTRLGAASRTEAVARAVQQHLVGQGRNGRNSQP